MTLSWWTLLGIALGLAMDAFAVAVASGLSLASVTPRHTFRLSFHFGLFQFLMPILGWLAGNRVAGYIEGYDHWLAFLLLTGVGGKMLWEAAHARRDQPKADPTRGWRLIVLSVATSLDALAVGLSMAFLGVPVLLPSVVIGIVAGLLTAVGITFGGRLGGRSRYWAEVAGGCVLVLIGANILISHVG